MPSPESVAASQDFYTRPDSYGGLWLPPDGKMVRGCVEPRPPEGYRHGEYPIIIQGPGAGIGDAQDSAIALTVVTGEAVSIRDGMDYDLRHRLVTVYGAHDDCLFAREQVAILGEIAEPSDFTEASVDRWAHHFNRVDVVDAHRTEVKFAAGMLVESMMDDPSQTDTQAMLDHVDRLHPGHQNVGPVKGENHSRLWVAGFHPHLGQDRNAKPADKEDEIQAYYDGLGAAVSDLHNAHAMPRHIHDLRFVAKLYRSAATRTAVIGDKLSEFVLLEVKPTQLGSTDAVEITEETH